MMLYYGIYPNINVVFLPLILILTFFTVTGIGLWFSALNVKYRDVKYVLPFFIQLLMFVSPVIYAVSFVPEKYLWVLYLNPIGGLIDAHRACLLGKPIDTTYLFFSVLISLIIFISGLVYFKKTESFFADII